MRCRPQEYPLRIFWRSVDTAVRDGITVVIVPESRMNRNPTGGENRSPSDPGQVISSSRRPAAHLQRNILARDRMRSHRSRPFINDLTKHIEFGAGGYPAVIDFLVAFKAYQALVTNIDP